jgi:peptide/nickel transport system substrate-binding protein
LRRVALFLLALSMLVSVRPGAATPEGQLTWAVHFTLAPTLFEPAETPGIVTPFMVLYALHDALVKPLPDQRMAPSLAESWSTSPDGLVYEFVLRQGVRFHNGEPVTADDVKFSFERYRGISAQMLKERVAAIETPDARHICFRLTQPWPDFMSFYGTLATGVGWVVPRTYVERVGEDGFKQAPVGAGPFRFVSFTPGVELVLEANEHYWREVVLHRIQQLIHDKAMYLPLWQLAVLTGYGPRVAEPGLGLIEDYPWAAPYEEVKLKAQ